MNMYGSAFSFMPCFLRWLVFLALTCQIALGDDPPNFIIFVADDMAWEDCGAYGHPTIRTPNIDRLANEGMKFTRAYLTCSSCSPSRCSTLTGRYPHSTGAAELHLPLPANQTMLTKPLMDAGYWTAAVGKWHLGNEVTSQVEYRKGSRPEAMGDAWVTALKARPKGKPFFLWAAHSDPHRGYKPGAVDPPHLPDQVVVPPYLPDTPKVRADLALYYDEVSRFDEHIGMVLAELEQQQLADDTLVLVMSDNGRPFPYCKTMVHVPGVRTPLVVRWPEKIRAGTVSRRVVSTIDIAPTVLRLAKLEPLKVFQGVDFSPLLFGSQKPVREYAFSEHNWHDYRAYERAVHTERYTFVVNGLPNTPATPPADAIHSPTYEEMKRLLAENKLSKDQMLCMKKVRKGEFLYDTQTDPDCIHHLHATNEVRNRLQLALAKWMSETKDRFPGEENLTPDGFDRDTGERLIDAAHPRFAN